jgi:hypothetical protein
MQTIEMRSGENKLLPGDTAFTMRSDVSTRNVDFHAADAPAQSQNL